MQMPCLAMYVRTKTDVIWKLKVGGESGTFPNPMYEASLNNFDKSQTEEFINNLSINWNINSIYY